MTLAERIAAAESCAVIGCNRARLANASTCREHTNALWGNRLTREANGEYSEKRQFVARELRVA